MSRVCVITGKGVHVGNNVSHAKNRTKKRFLPNLQNVTFLSERLGTLRMRVSVAGIRTVEKHGGIDEFLRTTRNSKLQPEALKLKRRLERAEKKQESTATAKAA